MRKDAVIENRDAWEKNVAGLRTPYLALLLAAAVLSAYFPAFFADLCSVDDRKMIVSFSGIGSWNFKSVFFPGIHGGWYYRPLTHLAFLFDKYLWNLDIFSMHLENVLLHVLNTTLVYWLAHQLFSVEGKKTLLPFLSALFFGIHPVNTEPVNWISGRADLLAGTFVLLSANFLLVFIRNHSYRFLWAALVFLFFGFLCKETALAFVLGIFFFLLAKIRNNHDAQSAAQGQSDTGIKRTLLVLLASSLVVVIFILMRSAALVSNNPRFGVTVQYILSQPVYAFFIFLRAFGFYMKKLFSPSPLNFAIVDADPLYELLAMPLVLLCLLIAWRRTLPGAVFLSGVFLMVPAFPIALRQLAWTPYAERYLYIPSAFIMIASVYHAGGLLRKLQDRHAYARKVSAVAAGILLAVMTAGTFHRSMIWMHNVTLLRDTVEKSPSFQLPRIDYAVELIERGDFENARVQLDIAAGYDQSGMLSVMSKIYHTDLRTQNDVDLARAYLLEREGRTAEAAAAYEQVFSESKERSVEALRRMVSLYGSMLIKAKSPEEKSRINKKLSMYCEKLYNRNDNPHIFYWIGKILLAKGDRRNAKDYFTMAYAKFGEGDPYKVFSERLIAWTKRR